MKEAYTPGHSPAAVQFMSARSRATHAAFFEGELRGGASLLDCGCGPGTITLGLAQKVAPGLVTAIDFAESQVELARARAAESGCANVTFRQASVYELPFADATFDLAFSNALFEHLAEPVRALREIVRVLKPGGKVGLCSPDWDGFVVSPEMPEVTDAIRLFTDLQRSNGGDPTAGRRLGVWAEEAGLTVRRVSARYEATDEIRRSTVALLADCLQSQGQTTTADALRSWGQRPWGLFALTWVEMIAEKPL